jgi:hypothetical protein
MSKVSIGIKTEVDLPPGEYTLELNAFTDDVSDYGTLIAQKDIDVPDIGTLFATIIDDKFEDVISSVACNSNPDNKLELLKKISLLGEFEYKIIELQIDRLLKGKAEYGDWKPNDGRNLMGDTVEEMIDAMAYMAASLIADSLLESK